MTVQRESKKSKTVLAFQLCVIANSVLSDDVKLYTVSKFIMLLFFLIMLISIFLSGGKARAGRRLMLPVLFTLYSMASVLWSYNPDVAWTQLMTQLQLALLLLFTYLIMLNGAQIKDYLDALYIAGWSLAIFALVRYGGLSNFLEVMEDGTRMGGEIANENTFGMVFSNATLAAAYYLVIHKQKKHIVSIAIFTFFALSSGSKKAALLIVVGILGIAIAHYGIKRLYKTLLIGAAVLVVAWLVLQLPIFATINKRLTSYFSGESNVSDDARANMIKFGLEMFKDKPIFGYGLNNYHLFYPSGQYSHNNYIEVLVSGGIVGLLLYYSMYLSPLYTIFLGRHKNIIKQDKQYLMILLWIGMDLIFGYGMVQMYRKSPHIVLGVVLAAVDKLDYEALRNPEQIIQKRLH